MTNKIKFSAPLLLAGLLLASCNKDGIGNRLYLDIEQPGSNGSKVLLSGTRTMWMDNDEIKVITGARSEDSYVKKVKYSSDRTEVYLDGDEIPQPAEGYYYLACYPSNLTSNNSGARLDDGRDYKTFSVIFQKYQYWYGHYNTQTNSIQCSTVNNIPMAAMTHRNARRLYMRPLAAVIDVQVTNNFTPGSGIGMKVNEVQITSNMPLFYSHQVQFYPGENSQRPNYINQEFPFSWIEDNDRSVILRTNWRGVGPNAFKNRFLPGLTLNFPISIAPTAYYINDEGSTPESTTLNITVKGETSIGTTFEVTGTASISGHIPGGIYYSASFNIDGSTEGTTNTEIDLKPYGSGLGTGDHFNDGGSI